MRFVYSVILTLLSPILLITLLKPGKNKPTISSRWPEYFGYTPELPENLKQSPIWFHAVSVGELLASQPIIQALRSKFPDTPIVITTTTTTGAAQAAKIVDNQMIFHRYMPVDFSFSVRRFIRTIKPSQLLIMETELWPNTLKQAHLAGLDVTILNARLSERSFLRYQKFQCIFNLVAPYITKVLVQHQEDAKRFIELGISTEKVVVTGSIKFDIAVPTQNIQQGLVLREQLGSNRFVWVAASTHAGEDEQILDAHKKLLKSTPDALLIIVPRHPERFDSVYNLILSQHLTCVRRTDTNRSTKDKSLETSLSNCQVYLADSMGEMMLILASADVCFIGGSLIGDEVGGHNLLEPAVLTKPILTGPSYFNFKDITNKLLESGGVKICESSSILADELITLLNNPDEGIYMGEMAYRVLKNNRGAVANTLAKIIND